MVCTVRLNHGNLLILSGFTEYLLGSSFHDDVSFMAEKFDKTTKLSFRDPNDPQYIRFGNASKRDPNLGIRKGQLKLDGYVFRFS